MISQKQSTKSDFYLALLTGITILVLCTLGSNLISAMPMGDAIRFPNADETLQLRRRLAPVPRGQEIYYGQVAGQPLDAPIPAQGAAIDQNEADRLRDEAERQAARARDETERYVTQADWNTYWIAKKKFNKMITGISALGCIGGIVAFAMQSNFGGVAVVSTAAAFFLFINITKLIVNKAGIAAEKGFDHYQDLAKWGAGITTVILGGTFASYMGGNDISTFYIGGAIAAGALYFFIWSLIIRTQISYDNSSWKRTIAYAVVGVSSITGAIGGALAFTASPGSVICFGIAGIVTAIWLLAASCYGSSMSRQCRNRRN